jgi:hypothetical protein
MSQIWLITGNEARAKAAVDVAVAHFGGLDVLSYPSRRRPAAPKACRRREEGRTHLLIHLRVEEQNGHRWCLWRPDHAGFDFEIDL